MALEFVTCPVCKQKLGIYDYFTTGTEVVCNNCETNLRIASRNPLRIQKVPYEETLDVNSRPESYG